MPKDKMKTHIKLVDSMQQEFLKYGYEKASLKNIAEKAGITPAGIYRHFSCKEAMFSAVVEPVTREFLDICNGFMEETYENFKDSFFLENFNEFRSHKNREFINYMYDHYDIFRLLLVCSKGTKYERFEEQLIEVEAQSIRDLFLYLDKRGLPHYSVSDYELHVLCTILVTAACEVIRHGYTREEALRHIDFVGRILYPGMKSVLGI